MLGQMPQNALGERVEERRTRFDHRIGGAGDEENLRFSGGPTPPRE